jgi:hypothetical protein
MEVLMKFYWFIWIPRILIIAIALFMALFSLDAFEGNHPLWEKLVGFLIHNIPSFLLLLCLVLTWKRPIIAGIIFLILTCAMTFFFRTYRMWESYLAFSIAPLLSSLLFIYAGVFRPQKQLK